MNGEETKVALYDIAIEKSKEYAKKLAELNSTSKNERKALFISKQVAENCASFTKIEYMNRFYEVREMRVYGQEFHDFDEWKPVYNTLSGDDKESFLVFSYAIIMVRHCLLNKRKDQLKEYEQHMDIHDQFEAKIIIGVIENILCEWQKFWNKYGCIPCEVIK